MILMIDNYDSFVYNLYQLIGSCDEDIKVIRNDELTTAQIKQLKPDVLVISPGPGRPNEAGVVEETIRTLYQNIPILGICLGHQALIESFGGDITYAKELMHGKSSMISIDTTNPLFQNMTSPTRVARYHSLVGTSETLPECLDVIAYSDDGEIMAVKHKDYPVYGLQFHPESILTDEGSTIIKNFLKEINRYDQRSY